MVRDCRRYPWHASCSIEWSLSSPCDRVSNLLETQMKVKSPCVAQCAHIITINWNIHQVQPWELIQTNKKLTNCWIEGCQALSRQKWNMSKDDNQSINHNRTQKLIFTSPKAWEGDKLCPNVSDTCPKMPCGQKCLYKVRSFRGIHCNKIVVMVTVFINCS